MFKDMKQANDILVRREYFLNDFYENEGNLYGVVVQKGNVGSTYLYALQLLNDQNNIYVFRGTKEYKSKFEKSLLS